MGEAMACGVVPIVTDIPSFRMMTDGGTIGGLFPPGDVDALVRVAMRVFSADREEQAQNAVDYFKARLSFRAIADELLALYEELSARR